MKLEREHVRILDDSSLQAFYHNASNPCPVLWHYHPEYEIVYLPGGSGQRRIGQHHGRYEDGELLLLGPNIPHLSYDYGQGPDFEEFVVQFPKELLSADMLTRPELAPVAELLRRADSGLVFAAEVRQVVGPQLQQLLTLRPWERLLGLLRILHELASTPAYTELEAGPPITGPLPAAQQRLNRVLALLEKQLAQVVSVSELAAEASLTVPAFCRFFKRMTQRTVTEFVNENRVQRACQLLLTTPSITDAAYASGFQNLSYFNRIFRRQMGESPSAYRRRVAAI